MTTGNNDELESAISGLLPPSILSLADSETRTLYASIIIILKVYPVLILVFGSCGNLLSFCVLLRAAMRRYSTFCYLACLALVDIGVIITFSVNFIALYHFKYDIQNDPFPCKLFAFCIYFLPQYSSWILVAVSIDRVISAKYLRLAKTWSKPRHSVLVTCLLGIFLALLNGHFFLYENNSLKQAAPPPSHVPRYQQAFLSNESAIENYLPSNAFAQQHEPYLLMDRFSVLRVSGSSMASRDSSASYDSYTPPPAQSISRDTTVQDQYESVINIKQAAIPSFDVNVIHCSLEYSKDHKSLYSYWVWIDLAMNVFVPFTAMIACTIIIILTLIRSSSRSGSTSARRSRRRRNISVMLITINLVFISLTAPIVIFLSFYEYFGNDKSLHRQTVLTLIKVFCIILMNLNHSVNIVIYSVTAKEFRSEMLSFLQALFYCLIGRPTSRADLAYLHNEDGTLRSRLGRLRRNILKCCRIRMRSNSTNTTDSSGLQHRTPTATKTANPKPRASNSNRTDKRPHVEGNEPRKCSPPRNSDTSTHGNNHRLTVQVQADGTSSLFEREDNSFHGLSVSTDD